jgi:hypothetical protein
MGGGFPYKICEGVLRERSLAILGMGAGIEAKN